MDIYLTQLFKTQSIFVINRGTLIAKSVVI